MRKFLRNRFISSERKAHFDAAEQLRNAAKGAEVARKEAFASAIQAHNKPVSSRSTPKLSDASKAKVIAALNNSSVDPSIIEPYRTAMAEAIAGIQPRLTVKDYPQLRADIDAAQKLPATKTQELSSLADEHEAIANDGLVWDIFKNASSYTMWGVSTLLYLVGLPFDWLAQHPDIAIALGILEKTGVLAMIRKWGIETTLKHFKWGKSAKLNWLRRWGGIPEIPVEEEPKTTTEMKKAEVEAVDTISTALTKDPELRRVYERFCTFRDRIETAYIVNKNMELKRDYELLRDFTRKIDSTGYKGSDLKKDLDLLRQQSDTFGFGNIYDVYGGKLPWWKKALAIAAGPSGWIWLGVKNKKEKQKDKRLDSFKKKLDSLPQKYIDQFNGVDDNDDDDEYN